MGSYPPAVYFGDLSETEKNADLFGFFDSGFPISWIIFTRSRRILWSSGTLDRYLIFFRLGSYARPMLRSSLLIHIEFKGPVELIVVSSRTPLINNDRDYRQSTTNINLNDCLPSAITFSNQ